MSNFRKFFFVVISLLSMFMQQCVVSQTKHDTLCVTKSGNKYHRCDCSYVTGNSHQLTLNEAIEQNYSPCSVCRPEEKVEEKQGSTPANSLLNNDQGETVKEKKTDIKSSTRCTALTQSGKRCKRKASSDSDRCWQHQEK